MDEEWRGAVVVVVVVVVVFLFCFVFVFVFFAFPIYTSGVHHFWVRFLRM